jgi:hypothetical protein
MKRKFGRFASAAVAADAGLHVRVKRARKRRDVFMEGE